MAKKLNRDDFRVVWIDSVRDPEVAECCVEYGKKMACFKFMHQPFYVIEEDYCLEYLVNDAGIYRMNPTKQGYYDYTGMEPTSYEYEMAKDAYEKLCWFVGEENFDSFYEIVDCV